MTTVRTRMAVAAAVACVAAALAGCERPPVETEQLGYRGVGMEQVINPRLLAQQVSLNQIPQVPPPAGSEGPRAGEVYKNVQLLGDLSVGEFTRLMVAMTQWVAPEQGCNYCHNPANLADDSLYTKKVARKMIQLTWNVNSDWKNHVANTGVTCYTCHRGHPVPANVWSTQPAEPGAKGLLGQRNGQNMPAMSVALADLPYDPYTPYLAKGDGIRVISRTALPTGFESTTQKTEQTYGLMIGISSALGVNCTFCHNTRSFASWEGPPARLTAYHGIAMVRHVNNAYIEPLAGLIPANREGPLGDVLKVNCATCHQGASKPLEGVSMLKAFPELAKPLKVAAAGAVTVGATATPVAAATTTQTSAPAADAVLGRILFRLDRTDLDADARATIARVAGALKSDPSLKVDLSGFADRSGQVDHNLDLAKQRAFAVRDALKAAGVAENRLVLLKPELVIGTADANWRRVDIVAAR